MTSDSSQISEREREILRLVATGATNQQIALRLNISINTVKVHLRNIYSKIGAASRTEATMYAVRTGLVQVSEAAATTNAPPVVIAEESAYDNRSLPTNTVVYADKSPDALPLSVVAPPEVIRSDEPELPRPASPIDQTPDHATEQSQLSIAPTSVLSSSSILNRRIVIGVVLGLMVIVIVVILLATHILVPSQQNETPTVTGVTLPAPTQRWHEVARMPNPRVGFALANANYDGGSYLYTISGETNGGITAQVDRYDLSTDIWAPLTPKPTPVTDIHAVTIGNKIYVPGGKLQSGVITNIFEMYDPQRDKWAQRKPLPQALSGYALAAVEGKLYLFGGWDGKTYRAEVWQYNPDLDEWTKRTSMPTARAFMEAVEVAGQVYVIGGEDQTGGLTVNERYTPAEDNGDGRPWVTKTPLQIPAKRIASAAAPDSGFVYVIGGVDTGGQILVYNITNNAWRSDSIPLGKLRDLRAQMSNNKIYILGGRDDTTISASTYVYQALYNISLPAVSK